MTCRARLLALAGSVVAARDINAGVQVTELLAKG